MRNMSFSMTTRQVLDRTKTVTRRLGWRFLRPGDRVMAVEKGQGLKRGEKIRRLCELEILGVRRAALYDITSGDVVREGFPQWAHDPALFVRFFAQSHGCTESAIVTRIEFRYV